MSEEAKQEYYNTEDEMYQQAISLGIFPPTDANIKRFLNKNWGVHYELKKPKIAPEYNWGKIWKDIKNAKYYIVIGVFVIAAAITALVIGLKADKKKKDDNL